jgi:hypothetical protein
MTTQDKREVLQRELDKYGKKNATFIYMGKPRTLYAGDGLIKDDRSAGVEIWRLVGLEKLQSSRSRINKKGKVLMRLIKADMNIRIDVRDIGTMGEN